MLPASAVAYNPDFDELRSLKNQFNRFPKDCLEIATTSRFVRNLPLAVWSAGLMAFCEISRQPAAQPRLVASFVTLISCRWPETTCQEALDVSSLALLLLSPRPRLYPLDRTTPLHPRPCLCLSYSFTFVMQPANLFSYIFSVELIDSGKKTTLSRACRYLMSKFHFMYFNLHVGDYDEDFRSTW